MPIRHYIDIDCPPRAAIGGEELVALLARWERAESIRAKFSEQYGTADESKMRFREKVTNAEGEVEKRELSVADLREECAALEEHAHHCRACPASLSGAPYSCTAAESFPISGAAEAWLVGQLPPAGSRALELFLDAALEHGYGENPRLIGWRQAGFLESPEPTKADRAGLEVTSAQVIEELFLVGDLMPQHLLGVMLHLGAMRASDGRTGDELLALIENVDAAASAEEAPTIDFGIGPDPADDESTRELKQFLFAGFRAFSLQAPLAIRM